MHFKVFKSGDNWYTTYNYMGGSAIDIGEPVPDSSLPFSKGRASYFGETHNTSTYLVGYSNRRVYFDSLRWRTDDWYSPSITCDIEGSYTDYHEACSGGVNGFSIWDDR